MVSNDIIIKGARVNNLKNIDVTIPRNKFVVITGLSGSGKSSLAFDTLYAEGQRRYVESLSSYARQFLGRMTKPDCDFIKGLPPAIAIEQKVNTRNSRSTVGTSTEIYDYLRLLFARIGKTYSPISGTLVKKHSRRCSESGRQLSRRDTLCHSHRDNSSQWQRRLVAARRAAQGRLLPTGERRDLCPDLRCDKLGKVRLSLQAAHRSHGRDTQQRRRDETARLAVDSFL